MSNLKQLLDKCTKKAQENVVTSKDEVYAVIIGALIDEHTTNSTVLNNMLCAVDFDWNIEDSTNLDLIYKLCKIVDSCYYDTLQKIKNFSIVHSVGGYEGGGEDVVRVLKVTNPSDKKVAFIKTIGWYSSYSGINWNKNEEFVKPFVTSTIVFE